MRLKRIRFIQLYFDTTAQTKFEAGCSIDKKLKYIKRTKK